MYQTVLLIHSWLRWLTLLMAVGAIVSAAQRAPERPGVRPGKWWDTLFMLCVDLQMAAGLVLYFGLSPTTRVAMTNVSLALRNPAMRFWAIEHAAGMFAALILVRIGRVLALNAPTVAAAQRRRLICFSLALAVILLVIPWPGRMNGRPLFRW